MELCLIGLFLLVQDDTISATPCKWQAVIMGFVFVVTILDQGILNRVFTPLLNNLSFKDKSTEESTTSVTVLTSRTATTSSTSKFEYNYFDRDRAVIWIPVDEKGIANNEIRNLHETLII